MTPVTADVLRAVAPRFSGANAQRQSQIIDAIAGDFTSILDEYEISTDLRVAHFLAQIIHESAGLRTTEEFASGAAYEGRVDLGNTVRGDGKRYKGRGVLQLTGRANYRRYGKILGLDLEGQPHIAAEPLVSLRIACVYWRDRNINPLCDADDLVGVTKKVNGGTNGLADRRQYLVKAKAALARAASTPPVVADAPSPPKEDSPKLGLIAKVTTASTSAAALNQLASEGSRLGQFIRSVKQWFWRGAAGTAVGSGVVSQTVDPNKGNAAIITDWIHAHPLWFAIIVGSILGVAIWLIIKRVEKWVLTAYNSGRYVPRAEQ